MSYSSTDAQTKPSMVDYTITQGSVLNAWENRYGSYIWVGLAPEYATSVLDEAQALTDAADIEALGFCEYLEGKGSWLPFSSGGTFSEAISSLEKKLCAIDKPLLQRGSSYWDSVKEVFKIIDKVSDGGYGIASAIDSGELPASYLDRQKT